MAADFTYVSTAGGAFLEWLGGARTAGGVALCPQRRPRRLPSPQSVMAGLVPANHAFPYPQKDVDARRKAGHDNFD